MKRFTTILSLLLAVLCAQAAIYTGRVVDQQGEPVPFATVYLESHPEVGTATGQNGLFTLETDLPASSPLMISFIGYKVLRLPLKTFLSDPPAQVVLTEQPIALQETVITAKASKQKNKKKKMAYLLYRVNTRMQADFPDTPTRYKIVSDVRMNASQAPWGMEQMIAHVVNIPGKGREGNDSVQFAGEYCKRFFKQTIRNRADSILAGNHLDKDLRKAAVEMDSGVVVHRSLWAIGNVRYDFERTINDLRHWSVSNESETETVLTHVESKNYLGIFKYEYKRHYIVDSQTFRMRRFSEQLTVSLNIPFGYKLKADQLELLNLLNMDENDIEKFRLRKASATVTLNTIYQVKDGRVYPQEKNLRSQAKLVGTKDKVIPLDVRATQRVTSIEPNAKPLRKSELTRRLPRQNVSVF